MIDEDVKNMLLGVMMILLVGFFASSALASCDNERSCKRQCDPFGMHEASSDWCICGGENGPTVEERKYE